MLTLIFGTLLMLTPGKGGSFLTTPPSISAPITRQVSQRVGTTGPILITGTCHVPWTSIQAQAIKNTSSGFTSGTDTAWVTIYTGASQPAETTFSGTLTVTGGWYDLSVRCASGFSSTTATTVSKVGVGEVFLLAGQSLAANYVTAGTATATNDYSEMLSIAGVWSKAADPQPSADGTGGSPVPALADLISTYLNLPVVIEDIAVGGSSIKAGAGGGANDWVYSTSGGNFTTKMVPATSQWFGTNTVRTVLWAQGETDCGAATSQADYTTGIETLMDHTRSAIGYSVDWMINKESDISGTPCASIQAAQAAAALYTNAFAGGDIDGMTGCTYRNCSFYPHLTTAGATEMATRMFNKLKAHYSW